MNPCVMCGNPGTQQWTLDDGDHVYVASLCDFHSAPLKAIGGATGTGPQPTVWMPAPPAAHRGRRNKLEPLDWVKPTS